MYRCILFDMDGTLIDSYEGIFHAYQWVFAKMGMPFEGEPFVRAAIGAPLPFVFERLCGLPRETALLAIRHYREYYHTKGKKQFQVYEGVAHTLQRLRDVGCFLGTATLKKEGFAKEILRQAGLFSFFDAICGMDENDRLTKADLIRRGMDAANASPEETVLVGDSEFDVDGARKAGVDFLAVTYGFGFHDSETLLQMKIPMVADTPLAIARLLCGGKGPGDGEA